MITPASTEKFNLPGWRKDVLRAGVAFVLAAFIIGLTMFTAKRHGMDHALLVSPGEEIAVSIALSDTIYGLHLGYVGFASVFNTIQEHWNQGANGWSNTQVLIDNFHNGQILNDGIRAAAALGPQKPGYFTDGSLITTIYDDMGEVDFYKLSFALFGMKIESLFSTYFLLLGLSALVFILTFRDNTFALAVLLSTLFAFYIELHLAVFDPLSTPTFAGMRHSSTLALVPMWYLALLLIFSRKPSPWLVVGGLSQLAIFMLAWRIRGSVAWMAIFLLLVSTALAIVRSWPAPWRSIRPWLAWARSWPMLLRDTLRWPIVLLTLGVLANGAYNAQSRHLIYSTDDVIPHHGLWWVATGGLYEYARRLEMPSLFDSRVTQTDGTPEGWWFVRDYLDRVHLIPWSGTYNVAEPAPGLTSPWTGGGAKYRLVDEVMKRMFFEAVAQHPREAFLIYWDYKVPRLLQLVHGAFGNAKNHKWVWFLLLSGAMVFGFVWMFEDRKKLDSAGKVLLVTAAAPVAAGLPNLWGLASAPVVVDIVLVGVNFMSIALGCVAYAAFRRLSIQPPS